MKEQRKTQLVIVGAVIVIALVVWFGFKTVSSAGSLDQGQIKYEPGKPPWEVSDPAMKGPGGPPTLGNGSK